jgi:thiosulfate/3-mercaptopyruvate sulfurtransferase
MAFLISPEELAARLDEPHIRIADVRWYLGQPALGWERYAAGHIPSAIFVDLDRDLSAARPGRHPMGGRHPLPDPRTFSARMAELGFGGNDMIIAYDDTGGTVAARLWWMLDDLGHREARVLDGGLAAWLSLALPLATAESESGRADEARNHVPGQAAGLGLRASWSRAIDRDQLASRLGRLTVLDVRAAERYRGQVEPVDAVPGHIPTAVSAPTTANIGGNGRFLAPDALAARFTDLGATGEVVTACGSGVNAAHTALAMRIAGLPAPLLYAGSYSDWTAAGMPVVRGSDPGEMPDPG